ncbi:MAG: response regulator [Elusimicrobiota bacterium]|nr:response regulator [Elusimicrobiota bacterium]
METNSIKLLVVEDERSYLRLLETYLAETSVRGRSFEVSGAETLSRALSLLETKRYDVILSDLFLPDSYGLNTFAAIADRAADTPVVVLTGLENEAMGQVALDMGAQDYLLKKEVTGKTLSRAIIYSIERKRIEVSLRASEERYRALTDSLDDAIAVIDRELNIIMANRAFKKASGAALPPDVTGGRLTEAVSSLPGKTPEICRRAFSERKIIVSEVTGLWNGRQSVLEIKCVPVAAGGGAEHAVIVARDITGRRQLE